MLNLTLEGLVGSGAYAKVYRARTKRNGLVAVKVLPRTGLNEDQIRLITTEIELLKAVRSPFVLGLLEFDWSKTEIRLVTGNSG